jgi:hypothetical protein
MLDLYSRYLNRKARHVARKVEKRKTRGIWYGDRKKRDQLEDLGVDGRILLKLSLKCYAVECIG